MAKKSMSADDLLTTAEAAKETGLSVRQMRYLAQRGRIPARQMGRDWLFRRGDVTAFVPRGPGRWNPNKGASN